MLELFEKVRCCLEPQLHVAEIEIGIKDAPPPKSEVEPLHRFICLKDYFTMSDQRSNDVFSFGQRRNHTIG